MHQNPIFRETPEEEGLRIALNRGFGVLTVAAFGAQPILAAHVPFLAVGARIEAHLMRSNPIAQALQAGPVQAMMIVSGPDAYVSPDWYGSEDRVPTWNYVAVHLRGVLSLDPPESLAAHLDRLSARFEAELAPKPVWTSAKMSEGVMARMMRSILPVSMTLDGVQSTVKLNQNRTASERGGVIAAMAAGGTPGGDPGGIAALMQGLVPPPL